MVCEILLGSPNNSEYSHTVKSADLAILIPSVIPFCHCLGVPKTTLSFDDSLGELQDSAYIILRAIIHYSERTQSKISKGKRHMGEGQRKPEASFQGSPPSGVTQMHLVPSVTSCSHLWRAVQQGHKRLGARVLTGAGQAGTSAWHIPKFQTPRRKQVSAETTLFANILTKPLSIRAAGSPPEIQAPRSQPKANHARECF